MTTTLLRIDVDDQGVTKAKVLSCETDPRLADRVADFIKGPRAAPLEDGRARRRRPVEVVLFRREVVPADLGEGAIFDSVRHLATALRAVGVNTSGPAIRAALFSAGERGKDTVTVAKVIDVRYALIRD